jgi:hypothetical protein
MPLIQRLIQREAGSPTLEVEPGPLDSNMLLHSSLPESAFLEILAALKLLPEFPRLLATVNEQGQTLLHLAIHLRYRELVQKLIHWGIDLNVRDVNGFTALHAGYLCDDLLVVGILEAEGAKPLVLDELGRSPTELAASIPSAIVITTGKDDARQNTALPTADMSRPRDEGNNIQACAVDATSQSADSAPHNLSGGHSARIETMGTGPGPDPSNLRQKAPTQLLNEHGQQGHTVRYVEYPCDGHTDYMPQWGCRIYVDGLSVGVANNKPSKKKAKQQAALEAATSLGLT